jgi:hypothetical protein
MLCSLHVIIMIVTEVLCCVRYTSFSEIKMDVVIIPGDDEDDMESSSR